jgi:hypothetical protein
MSTVGRVFHVSLGGLTTEPGTDGGIPVEGRVRPFRSAVTRPFRFAIGSAMVGADRVVWPGVQVGWAEAESNVRAEDLGFRSCLARDRLATDRAVVETCPP